MWNRKKKIQKLITSDICLYLIASEVFCYKFHNLLKSMEENWIATWVGELEWKIYVVFLIYTFFYNFSINDQIYTIHNAIDLSLGFWLKITFQILRKM